MTERPARRLLAVFAAVFVAAGVFVLGAHSADGGRDDLSKKDRKRVASVTRLTTDFSAAEQYEAMSGGAATSLASVNLNSFSHFSENITFAEEETFKLGNALFQKLWVSSPSSTQASDGLGPLYNARSCQTCHIKDGRGHPPEGAADASSMFLRLARPATTPEDEAAQKTFGEMSLPDPIYGRQLQDLAVPGLKAEGRMVITYRQEPVTLAGGEVVMLRRPTYAVTDLAYGALDKTTTLSPRVTQPMLGLGLIQAIHPADILALADPDDADGDGISGKAAIAIDPKTGKQALGRFGWKAQSATVRQQSADAFAFDIGISTPEVPLHHGDCMPAQVACLERPDGVQKRLGDVEAPPPIMDLVTFYAENLAVPARRKASFAETLAGKRVFYETGCVSCHQPKFVTRRDAENKAHAFQLIWPYSDFLLHDMGEGLADGQAVGVANGREWRTPPLWGIGLTKTVNGHTFFLHDGRARNLTEAILWHGGEAKAARDRFTALEKQDRYALLTFLESL
ncbi:di-heme oxidoredictase family protein [Shinella kummerowiae]|uniref:di-heme oxidoreductase family protein n=1 Tax=Shinella kummerowiae TaxID=417745 RepID=UPI0021B5E4CB|nr:di-heme oxidoredictase family protein [Shinella kummerowiae]MCT7665236.1 c-type cytochrome [Shinella kummerowiae]